MKKKNTALARVIPLNQNGNSKLVRQTCTQCGMPGHNRLSCHKVTPEALEATLKRLVMELGLETLTKIVRRS
jgi:hypothetical protein